MPARATISRYGIGRMKLAVATNVTRKTPRYPQLPTLSQSIGKKRNSPLIAPSAAMVSSIFQIGRRSGASADVVGAASAGGVALTTTFSDAGTTRGWSIMAGDA